MFPFLPTVHLRRDHSPAASRTLHPQWHDAEASTHSLLILPHPFHLPISGMSLPCIRPHRSSARTFYSIQTKPPSFPRPPLTPTPHSFSPPSLAQAQNASLTAALILLLKSYPPRSSSQTTAPVGQGLPTQCGREWETQLDIHSVHSHAPAYPRQLCGPGLGFAAVRTNPDRGANGSHWNTSHSP